MKNGFEVYQVASTQEMYISLHPATTAKSIDSNQGCSQVQIYDKYQSD